MEIPIGSGFCLHISDTDAERIDGLCLELKQRGAQRATVQFSRVCALSFATGDPNADRLHPRNTSGATGIYWRARTNSWQVFIFVDGHLRHVGYYKDKHTAIAARQAAQRQANQISF